MNPTIESLRIIAIAGIVWIHTPESEEMRAWTVLGRFAVPFFAATSAYLAVGTAIRKPQFSVSEFVRTRPARIYLMFLGWTAIYLVIRLLAAQLDFQTSLSVRWQELLYNGSTSHLWFLPFIAVGTTAAFLVGRCAERSGKAMLIGGLTITLAAMAAVGLQAGWLSSSVYVVRLSLQALPSLMIGAALGVLRESSLGAALEGKAGGLGAGFVAALSIGWLVFFGRQLVVENIAGVGLLLMALSFPKALSWPALSKLGALSFAVYIVHIMPLEFFQDVLRACQVSPSSWIDLALFATVLLLSLCVAQYGQNLPVLGSLLTLRSKPAQSKAPAGTEPPELTANAIAADRHR